MHIDIQVEMLTGHWNYWTTVQGQGWEWRHALVDELVDKEFSLDRKDRLSPTYKGQIKEQDLSISQDTEKETVS